MSTHRLPVGKMLWALLLLMLPGLSAVSFAQDLFVSSYGSRTILRYDGTTGAPINLVVPTDYLAGSPTGVVVGPDGDLYVDDSSAARILRFDSVTGVSKGVFAQISPSNLPAGVSSISYLGFIGFGPDGYLYACFDGSPGGSIVRFYGPASPTPGALKDVIVPAGYGGLTDPRGFTFDAAGDLYVSSDAGHEILRYDTVNGTFKGVFVPNDANGPESPHQIAFGPDGKLYVACAFGACVRRYNGPDSPTPGAFVDIFVAAHSGGLTTPVGLGFGPNNNLYISDVNQATTGVRRYDGNTGAYIDDFVTYGSNGLYTSSYLTFANVPNPPVIRVGSLGLNRGGQSAWCSYSAFHDAIRQALPGVHVNFIVSDSLTPEFLSQVDVLLLGSVYNGANVPVPALSSSEQQALYNFVATGKGTMLVGDSFYFDPANNSFFNPFGFGSTGLYNPNNGGFALSVPDPTGNPLTGGAFGQVTAPVYGYAGWFYAIHPSAIPVAYLPNGGLGIAYLPRDALTLYAFGTPGSGAIAAFSDAEASDIFTFPDNRILFLNTIADLAKGTRPPLASNQTVTMNANAVANITLAATDPLGLPLTYTVVSNPANGILSGTAPNLAYTPNTGFTGTDTFTFRANDGMSNSNVATVTINVQTDARIATTLTVTGGTGPVGTKVTVSSTLRRANATTGVASATVIYKLDGVAQGTRTTGANGGSSFALTLPDAIGNHILTVEFAGDAQFQPTTGSAVVVATAPILSAITLSPANVNGGSASTGTVKLTGTAAADTIVSLQNANSAATVPASVTVPAGTSSATFSITTVPVTDNVTGAITAALDVVTKSANLTVKAPALSAVTLVPVSVTGGASATGTVKLTSVAAVDTVISLTSDNPATASVPDTVTVPAGSSSTTFSVATVPVAANTVVTVTATSKGVSKSDTLTVKAPALATLTLSPTSVFGGTDIAGRITLNGVAAVDTVVTISSANTAVHAPPTVTVPAGSTSATFTLNTDSVTANSAGAVTATLDAVAKSVSVTAKAPTFTSLILTPNPVIGGNTVTGTVTMSGPVAVDTVVTLTNTNTRATLPGSTVTVPAGSAAVSFTITTVTTTATVSGTVKATIAATTRSVILKVTP